MKQNDIVKKTEECLSIAKNIEKSGCYFLSLLYAGLKREPIYSEILSSYEDFVEAGLMDEDCFIKNPTGILHVLTNKKFTVKKSDKYGKSDIAIALWHNKRTGFSHFVLMRDEKTVLWDPIFNSTTVKEGVIESWRLFKGDF